VAQTAVPGQCLIVDFGPGTEARPVVEKSKKRPKLRNPAQADCRAPDYHRACHGDFGSLTGRERTVMTDISRRAIMKATGAAGATILPIATATDHGRGSGTGPAQPTI
jgi:hypothetical protein